MLPDFRFAIGAILAITMLGITGFGLAMSVELMHEAGIGSFQASRSLAFTEHAEWNQFYDPDAARRFQGLDAKADDPVTEVSIDTAAAASPTVESPTVASPVVASPTVALAAPEDQTAGLSSPDAGAVQAADTDTAPVKASAPSTDDPGTSPQSVVEATPDAPERVASAPAAPSPPRPSSDAVSDDAPPAQPSTGAVPLPPKPPKPVTHARPKRRHLAQIAHAHAARVAQPTNSDSTFPNANGQWPSFDGPLNNTIPSAKKGRTQISGSFSGR